MPALIKLKISKRLTRRPSSTITSTMCSQHGLHGKRTSIGNLGHKLLTDHHLILKSKALIFVDDKGGEVAVYVYLSDWVHNKKVIRRKSAKNYNARPYISALLCKSLFAFYGTLDPDGLLIVTVKALIFVGIMNIGIPGAGHGLVALNLNIILVTALIFVGIMNIGIPGAVILATLLGFHGSVRQTFIGIICAVVTIAIYAAPLSVMVSNAIGILSSSAQLVIYMIYRKNSSSLNIKPQEESKEYLKEQFEDSLPSIEEGKIQSQDFDQIKQQPSRFKS
ncbi:hypothetical protein LguiA_026558 [Lonicera macranthoides]